MNWVCGEKPWDLGQYQGLVELCYKWISETQLCDACSHSVQASCTRQQEIRCNHHTYTYLYHYFCLCVEKEEVLVKVLR